MQQDRKRPDIAPLTGLRGLAALLIVVTHYWGLTRVTAMSALPASLEPWTHTAGIGMAIFFTLSGYVIALSYSHWNWRERPIFNLTRLFFYRFARLYPAFFLFAILAILRFSAIQDLSDPDVQAYVVPHLLLWQTWWPLKFGGTDAASSYFHVSWSISTECALYLLFGLGAIAAALLPPWRRKSLILAVAFFMIAATLLTMAWLMRHRLEPPGWSDKEWSGWLFYLSPYGVSVQFGIGVVAYRLSRLPLSARWVKRASDLGALGLVALYLLIVVNTPIDSYVGGILLAVVTGLLMIGATSDSVANRLLSGRGIVYVGTISYSLYLFHFLVPAVAFHGEFPAFDGTAAAYFAVNFLTSVAVAIMLATGVYRLVEVPGRRIIRAAADRLLGIGHDAAVASEQPAE